MTTLTSTRRKFLIAGAAGLLLPRIGRSTERSAERPNIVFIMADDLGYADLSCYGRRDYRTPNIDRLAAEGIRLQQAYSNSAICSPTRVALATGRYQQRFRVGLEEPLGPGLPDGSLPAGAPTIATRFKALGYRTALVGKWHIGTPPHNGPLRFGYDEFFGIPSGAADYFSHRVDLSNKRPEDGLFRNDERIDRNGYLTDLLTDEAIRLVRSAGSTPLFLSLHYNAPHWPWEGPHDEEVSRKLKDIFHRDGGSLEAYAAMVTSMDANIGRLLATLEAERMTRDTVVVFTSDNGGERFSDNWPLTGIKGELLEGGIRVPLIVRWPERIAAGTTSEQVMVSMDFVPTLLAAAGGPAVAPGEVDGENVLPVLLAQASLRPRRLFWRFKASEQAAVRDGDWKYLKLGGKEHLFDVAKDPRERVQLKDAHPDVFDRLKRAYAQWNASMLPYPEGSFSEELKKSYAERY